MNVSFPNEILLISFSSVSLHKLNFVAKCDRNSFPNSLAHHCSFHEMMENLLCIRLFEVYHHIAHRQETILDSTIDSRV